MMIVLVGGRNDGRRLNIQDGMRCLEMAAPANPVNIFAVNGEVPLMDVIEKETYFPQPWEVNDNGDRIEIWAIRDMTPRDVLLSLLADYRPVMAVKVKT